MAFPAINAQQELNNRKILEELQLKKHLLTKSGAPTSTGLQGAFNHTASLTSGMPSQQQQQQHQHQQPQPQSHQQQSQQNDITFNNTSRAAWIQATNQSSCFFLHQDSGYGNSILPVLPRFDPPQ